MSAASRGWRAGSSAQGQPKGDIHFAFLKGFQAIGRGAARQGQRIRGPVEAPGLRWPVPSRRSSMHSSGARAEMLTNLREWAASGEQRS